MQKTLWQIHRKAILKNFLFLVALPIGGFLIGMILALLLNNDKSPLWTPILGISVIGLIWAVVGLWKWVHIVGALLNFSKWRLRFFIGIVAIIAGAAVYFFDLIMSTH